MTTHTIRSNLVSAPHVVAAGSVVTVTPDAGASAVVEYTTGSAADIRNGVAVWRAWPRGTVTAPTYDVFAENGYVRVTPTGGAASYEVNNAPSVAVLGSLKPDWATAPDLRGQSQGVTAVIVGDSRSAQNFVLHYISSISRANGIVSVTFSGSALDSPFAYLWPGCPIQVENIGIEDVRGKRTIRGGAGNTWTFDAPGADFAAFTPPSNPHVMNLAHYASNGWFVRMNARSMGKFDLLDVVAAVGRGTDEMVARLPDALASKAVTAWVFAGINDFLAGIKTWEQILENVKTIALALRDSGKRTHVFTEAPLYGASNTAARALGIVLFNQALRKFARETPGIRIVDIYRALVNPAAASNGEAKQYMLAPDNLHPSSNGANEISKVSAAAAADIPFTDTRITSNAETYGFNALNSNRLDSAPFAAGAADVPYAGSQVGLNYSGIKEGNSNAVFSVAARSDGVGLNNRVVYTATGNNEGARWHSPNINGARVMNSMRVYSETTVKTTGIVAGNGKAIRHYMQITLANAAGNAAVSALADVGEAASYMPQEDVEMVLRTPTVTLPIAPTNIYAVTGLASSAAGAAVTLDMGVCRIDVQPA